LFHRSGRRPQAARAHPDRRRLARPRGRGRGACGSPARERARRARSARAHGSALRRRDGCRGAPDRQPRPRGRLGGTRRGGAPHHRGADMTVTPSETALVQTVRPARSPWARRVLRRAVTPLVLIAVLGVTWLWVGSLTLDSI